MLAVDAASAGRPVQISGGIGGDGRDLENIRAQFIRDVLCHALRVSRAGEISHQNFVASAGVGLRGNGRHRQVVAQDRCHLCAGRVAVRVKAVAGGAVHHAVRPRPIHGGRSVSGDAALVGKILSGFRTGRTGVAPEDRGDLGAADGIVGAEAPVAVASHDAVGTRPCHRIRVVGTRRNVREGRSRGSGRAARGAVQNRHQHGAGHGRIGAECGSGGAVHNAVLIDIIHRIRVPCTIRNVAKDTPCRQGRRNCCDHQRCRYDRRQKSLHLFRCCHPFLLIFSGQAPSSVRSHRRTPRCRRRGSYKCPFR